MHINTLTLAYSSKHRFAEVQPRRAASIADDFTCFECKLAWFKIFTHSHEWICLQKGIPIIYYCYSTMGNVPTLSDTYTYTHTWLPSPALCVVCQRCTVAGPLAHLTQFCSTQRDIITLMHLLTTAWRGILKHTLSFQSFQTSCFRNCPFTRPV